MNLFKLFQKKKKPQPTKRNFDNVSWTWCHELGGKPAPPFHIFSFKNGLGVLVLKHSRETWDGMEVIAIDDIKGSTYRQVSLPNGLYCRKGGINEQEVLAYCETVKNCK